MRRRILRIAVGASLVLVVFLAVLIGSFLRPGVREFVGNAALRRADEALPGSLRAEKLRWPTPGHVVLERAVWLTDTADSAFAADRIEVVVGLWPLLRRDLEIRRLALTGIRADVSGLQELGRAFAASAAAAPEPDRPPAFPRPGAVPGIPSIALENVHIEVTALREPGSEVPATLDLAGSVDLRQGHVPRIDLRRLEADNAGRQLRVRSGEVRIDPRNRVAEGRIHARWSQEWGFVLDLETPEPDRFRLRLHEEAAEGVGPDAVVAEAMLQRDGAEVVGVRLEAAVWSPTAARLAAVPGLAPVFGPLPPDERLDLTLNGDWDLRAGRGRVELRAGAFAAWDSLSAEVDFSPEGTTVPAFRVSGPGISASGDWSGAAYHVDAAITGLDWARPWAGDATLPDALDLRLTAVSESAAGSGAAADSGPPPGGRLLLEGWIRQGDVSVDSVSVRVDGRLTEGPLAFDLAARARGVWLQAAGAVTERAPWRIECVPLRVAEARGAVLGNAPRGVITVGERGDVAAEGIRVTGDFGQGSLRADWSALNGGEVSAELLWPEAPRRFLESVSDSVRVRERIAARWKEVPAPRVRLEGRAGPRADPWNARVRFQLPPPDVFGALAGESVRTADLAALKGEAVLVGTGADVRATIDASADGWWEMLHAEIRTGARGWAVDTVSTVLLGLRAAGTASASADGDSLEGLFHLDLDNLEALRVIVPDLPPDLEAAAAADVRLSGTPDAPDADIQATARAAATAWSAPAMAAGAEIRAGRLESARARAVDPVRAGDFAFGRVELEARPLGETGFLASVSVDSDSLGLDAVASLEPTETPGWLVTVDTLATRWSERDLRTTKPFRVVWDAAARAPSVEAMELRGTLGSFRADGAWPESLEARLVLKDPPRAVPGPPPAVWPSEVVVELNSGRVVRDAGSTLRVATRVRVDGLDFGPVRGGILNATIVSVADGTAPPTTVALVVSGEGAQRLTGELRLPHTWNESAGRIDGADGDWAGELQLRDFPFPGRLGDPGAFARFLSGEDATSSRFTGEVRIGGTAIADSTRATSGTLSGDLTFPEQPRLRAHRLHASAEWQEAGGLDAAATWFRADRAAAEVEAALPGARVGLTAPFAPGDSLRSRVQLTDWILDDLNSLLPAGVKVEGRVLGDVSAEGPPRRPRLSGWFEAKELGFTSARGDRARAGGRLEFGGTADAPKVTGNIEVSRALLLIPDPPRTLHPTQGGARLWPAAAPAAPADTAAAPAGGPANGPAPVSGAASAPAPAPAPDPVEALDLGIDLSFPRSCRITGRGLDVEMAGELSLVFRQGLPRLEGALRTVSGTFSFMGSRFTVDRGVATFYGTEDLDPDLDIELSRQKGDVRAIVRVTGRSTAPTISITSEPSMEEADILAHLLFGETGSDLDGEQTKFVENQAAAALRSFAIPGLERTVGSQLGLDVVQLGGGEEEGDALSVTIGKYLSPRALLKYDQALGRPEDFSIHLVYWLSRRLLVETTTSRHAQSGVDLNWSSEY